MTFSNLLFLYILLPVFIAAYYLIPDMKRKNVFLLGASLLLYGMGNVLHMALLVALGILNWKLALRMDPRDHSTLLLPVALNLAVLAAFKYVAPFLNTVGMGSVSISFPLGLSFFVFSVISYLIDVYSERVYPEENALDFLLYLLMFPKLLVGPVVRYEQVCDQLVNRRHHPRAVFEGLQRFVFGLAKKVLLADHCGMILAEVNAAGGNKTLLGVWFAAILFMFRLYYDFSGYCDIAIGLGKVFGFRFGENFRRPLLSLSVRDFFDNWNISVGRFFRTYIFLPLGGKQLGRPRYLLNLLLVCLLGGIWHGAGMNFLVWGIYIFVILVLEESALPMLETLPDWTRRCVTLWFVLLGWIIFSSESLSGLKDACLAVLGYGHWKIDGLGTVVIRSIPLLILCFAGCTEFPIYVQQLVSEACAMGRRRKEPNRVSLMRTVYLIIVITVMLTLLWLCTVSLVQQPGLPPVYGCY